jgi:hypothetical protein
MSSRVRDLEALKLRVDRIFKLAPNSQLSDYSSFINDSKPFSGDCDSYALSIAVVARRLGHHNIFVCEAVTKVGDLQVSVIVNTSGSDPKDLTEDNVVLDNRYKKVVTLSAWLRDNRPLRVRSISSLSWKNWR